MSNQYITYGVESTHIYKYFDDLSGAKRSATCHNKKVRKGYEKVVAMERSEYEKTVVYDVEVVNFMSGKKVKIQSNTPNCCNPGSETYWSM